MINLSSMNGVIFIGHLEKPGTAVLYQTWSCKRLALHEIRCTLTEISSYKGSRTNLLSSLKILWGILAFWVLTLQLGRSLDECKYKIPYIMLLLLSVWFKYSCWRKLLYLQTSPSCGTYICCNICSTLTHWSSLFAQSFTASTWIIHRGDFS